MITGIFIILWKKTMNNVLRIVILEIMVLHLRLFDNLYLKKELLMQIGLENQSIIQ
jgi:hypothetical protein